MARGTVTPEEIAAVRAAMVKLRALRPFRGQSLLLRDVERQLAELAAAEGGQLSPEARAEQAWAQRGAGI